MGKNKCDFGEVIIQDSPFIGLAKLGKTLLAIKGLPES